MTTTETEAAPSETEPVVRTSPKKRKKRVTKKQPPYAVVLHNDEVNTMEFVVDVLGKVFHYGREKAMQLMLEAHETGRSIVWSGTLEVAELKADQVRSCGPDPEMKQRGATALDVSVEPLPG